MNANPKVSMDFLSIDQVVKRYGDAEVIRGVSLAAREGEFVVFVGPSGCGKSTLLRMVAGLDEVSDGRIGIAGADVTDVPPADRGVAMVFQSYALYPHMSVRENMSFGLKMMKTPRDEITRRVDEAAAILRLEALLDRKPRQLSGGQRQRVAIGRAIVRKPKLFLFDEPLSNLDAELRGEMRFEIAKLHKELGVTMVYVTHDQVEAMTLADRIVVLRAGRIEQVGTPAELYERPANTFVAGFIGAPKMNFLTMTVRAIGSGFVRLGHPALQGGEVVLPLGSRRAPAVGASLTLGVRPEHLRLGLPTDPDPATGRVEQQFVVDATAGYVENLGGSSQLHAQARDGSHLVLQLPGRCPARDGEALAVSALPEQLYLFDADGLAL